MSTLVQKVGFGIFFPHVRYQIIKISTYVTRPVLDPALDLSHCNISIYDIESNTFKVVKYIWHVRMTLQLVLIGIPLFHRYIFFSVQLNGIWKCSCSRILKCFIQILNSKVLLDFNLAAFEFGEASSETAFLRRATAIIREGTRPGQRPAFQATVYGLCLSHYSIQS